MTRTTSPRALGALALLLVLFVPQGLALAAPAPAAAAVPGLRTVGRLAFTSGRSGGDLEIYVMNSDGTGQVNLTNHPSADGEPAWSPDGSKIAFASDRDGTHYLDCRIYVMNADGSGATQLTDGPYRDNTPAWSPDGSRIAYKSWRDGNYDIYVINADGSGATNLTNSAVNEYAAAWSPDGSRIAFSASTVSREDVYVMNADGSGRVNLTGGWPDGGYSPAWSPDGNRIAFVSGFEGMTEIYLMNADGSGVTMLTHDYLQASYPAWSPDGTQIAYAQWGRSPGIYLVGVDGGSQTRLTYSTAGDTEPDWAPGVKGAFDLSVSLYRNPTVVDRGRYEAVMRYLAGAVYEASNGGMLLGAVTFYTGGGHAADANVIWQAGGAGSRCWPMAQVAGYGLTGWRIAFCDVGDCVRGHGSSCGSEDYLSDGYSYQSGGYALAHEIGHYLFGLYDEHAGSGASIWQPWSGDTPVANSIMNQQRLAIEGGGQSGDLSYLNFSTGLNNAASTNAQYRAYGASAWETLVRSPGLDPRDGERTRLPPRLALPLLAAYAPAQGQAPTIELPAGEQAAWSALSFVWRDSPGSQDESAAAVGALDRGTTHPGDTVAVYAMAMRGAALIAGATIAGEAVDPEGTHFAVAFADDGVAPDLQAGDGIYTAVLTPPAGGLLPGEYTVSATLSNPGAAVYTYASYATSVAPDGSQVVIPDAPVGGPFTAAASLSLTVGQRATYLPLLLRG